MTWQLSDPVGLGIIALLFVLVVIQTLRLAWLRGLSARRMNANRALGVRGEARARQLLETAGYHLLEEQSLGRYTFFIDEMPNQVQLRADFIVRQGDQIFLAEAKGGLDSADLAKRNARRQLLEYTLAFDVAGILLVDTARGHIQSVRFPGQGRHKR